MRRSILLAGTTALALTLAACGGGGGNEETSSRTEETTSAAEETTAEETSSEEGGAAEGSIVVWVDENRQEAIQAAADAYTAESGVAVELVVKNFEDIQADFTAQVPTGEGPNLTIGAHDWVGKFAENGVIAPIELGETAGDYSEASVAAFTIEGQTYGVPMSVESTAIIRNVDLAPEPTPATFDEMIAAGEATGAEYPFLIQMGEEGDPYHMYAFQTSFGAPVFNTAEDGTYLPELALGGEAGQAFAEWLGAQGAAGTLNTAITGDIAKEKFAEGASPYILGGPWLIQDFEGMNLAVDPIPSAGGEPAAPFMGVQGIYLSAQSENALFATDFAVNYIGSEETQTAIFEAGNRIPANSAAAEAAMADPMAAGFAAISEYAQPMPTLPQMNEVWGFWGVTEAQIVGGADPVATWDKMVSDIEGAIS